MPSMTEITCKCGCGRKKMVRTADVRRGWGSFYDKRCKAVHQSRSGGSDSYYKAVEKAHNEQAQAMVKGPDLLALIERKIMQISSGHEDS